VARNQGVYLTTTDDGAGALDNIIPMTADYAYPGDFPGYVGMEGIHRPTQAYIPGGGPAGRMFVPNGFADSVATDTPTGNIDYESWGEMGEVDRNAYSIYGPVEPNIVENFGLYGEVLPGQRRPEYANGPVGAYDHGSYTSMQIAQQMADVAYNEASIMSLLVGAVQ